MSSLKFVYSSFSLCRLFENTNAHIHSTRVNSLLYSVWHSADVHSPDTDMILKIWAEDRTSFHQLTIPYEATILRG